jgi:hypothetical protein
MPEPYGEVRLRRVEISRWEAHSDGDESSSHSDPRVALIDLVLQSTETRSQETKDRILAWAMTVPLPAEIAP